MKFWSRFFILILLVTMSGSGVSALDISSWYDQSHNIFVPEAARSELIGIREFPVFWWNFVVIQVKKSGNQDSALQSLDQACREFSKREHENIKKISCGFQLGLYEKLISDWVRDYPRRHDAPDSAELKAQMNSSIAKASLPLPTEILKLLRLDPVNSAHEFQLVLQKHSLIPFEQIHGMYFDPATSRALIAVQFAFSPVFTKRTEGVLVHLRELCDQSRACDEIHVVGPHASTLENEFQIRSDLNFVSWFGTLLMFIFIGLVVSTGRFRLVYLIPPLILAVGVSTLLTILFFGRIHGLTLSFGPGIVGLCMHYGLQTAFSYGDDQRIWKANLFGILTTLAILLAVIWSQIPLIQQIMFFSSVGLVVGFSLFYLIHKKYPNVLKARPVHIRLPQVRILQILMLAIGLFSIVSIFLLKVNFGIQQLNFESAENSKVSRWLYSSVGFKPPLVHFYDPFLKQRFDSVLKQVSFEENWAVEHHVQLSSIAEFLPSIEEQEKHLTTWKSIFCQKDFQKTFTEDELKFFEPFLQNLRCESLVPNDLSRVVPEYIKDFQFEKQWLSLWNTKADDEVALVKKDFPGSSSLLEIISSFPKVLSQELTWMIPLAFLLAYALLVIYCETFKAATLALIPFFTGMGLFCIVALVFQWPITFISFIGFIKVFGFSLDYGIFVTDVLVDKNQVRAEGIWSALGLNSISTTLGFLPLLFCGHPVLKQLGEVLVFGSIGSYFGAVWGITPFVAYLGKRAR